MNDESKSHPTSSATFEARVRAIADRAIGRCGDARERYLHDACNGDSGLRAAVDLRLSALPSDPAAVPGVPEPQGELSVRPGDRISSEYTVSRVIGRGGMGVVVLARDETLGQSVAIKLLEREFDPEAQRRFNDEQKRHAKLSHENIVRLYRPGTWVQPGTGRIVPYFVMEFIEGAMPIDDHCEQERLGVREILLLFLDAVRAVQYVHENGLIHRDLTPRNILVSRPGHHHRASKGVRVVVIDFGLARDAAAPVDPRSAKAGTPSFKAPEQEEGASIDARTDVFALGRVLALLLQPVAVSVPVQLRKIVDRATSTAPRDRYPEAGDFGSALVGWLTKSNAGSSRRELLLRTAISSLAAAGAGAGGMRWWLRRRDVTDAPGVTGRTPIESPPSQAPGNASAGPIVKMDQSPDLRHLRVLVGAEIRISDYAAGNLAEESKGWRLAQEGSVRVTLPQAEVDVRTANPTAFEWVGFDGGAFEWSGGWLPTRVDGRTSVGIDETRPTFVEVRAEVHAHGAFVIGDNGPATVQVLDAGVLRGGCASQGDVRWLAVGGRDSGALRIVDGGKLVWYSAVVVGDGQYRPDDVAPRALSSTLLVRGTGSSIECVDLYVGSRGHGSALVQGSARVTASGRLTVALWMDNPPSSQMDPSGRLLIEDGSVVSIGGVPGSSTERHVLKKDSLAFHIGQRQQGVLRINRGGQLIAQNNGIVGAEGSGRGDVTVEGAGSAIDFRGPSGCRMLSFCSRSSLAVAAAGRILGLEELRLADSDDAVVGVRVEGIGSRIESRRISCGASDHAGVAVIVVADQATLSCAGGLELHRGSRLDVLDASVGGPVKNLGGWLRVAGSLGSIDSSGELEVVRPSTITGSLYLSEPSLLRFDAASPSSTNPQIPLVISGEALLGGRLEVRVASSVDQLTRIPLLLAKSLRGEFASVRCLVGDTVTAARVVVDGQIASIELT